MQSQFPRQVMKYLSCTARSETLRLCISDSSVVMFESCLINKVLYTPVHKSMNVTSVRIAKHHGNIHFDSKWDEKEQYL